jgi:hypothetical protein
LSGLPIPFLISFAASLLREAGIQHSVADSQMSVIDGSSGAIPTRVMITQDRLDEARRLLADAGVRIEAI